MENVIPNWLGIREKGCGPFSNNAKTLFGAAPFCSASIVYDGQTLDLTITLRY